MTERKNRTENIQADHPRTNSLATNDTLICGYGNASAQQILEM